MMQLVWGGRGNEIRQGNMQGTHVEAGDCYKLLGPCQDFAVFAIPNLESSIAARFGLMHKKKERSA